MSNRDDLQIKQGIVAVKDLVRWASLAELKNHGESDPLTLIDGAKAPGPVYAPGMALIVLASKDFRVTLKVFYSVESGRRLVVRKLRKSSFEVTEAWIADYMKELMNMIAGSVKRQLTGMNLKLGMSLPIVMRGFDEIYEADFMKLDPCECDLWTVETFVGDLTFKTTMEIFNSDAVNALSWSPDGQAAQQEMEFL